MDIIKKTLDRYFDFIYEKGGNRLPKDWIPAEMIGPAIDDKYSIWLAIPSTVNDKEIDELKKYWTHKIPHSFEHFLKYRHFIELELGINGIRFFPNKPGKLVEEYKKETESLNPELISKNFLPFAHMGDYELLCFDTNKSTNTDYPIVSFDLEDDFEDPQPFADNFEHMFIEFEDHLNQWINNVRNKNTLHNKK